MSEKKVRMNKAKDILSKTFIESCDNLNEDDINALLAKSLQRTKALKEELESDERLQAAKTIVKDLSDGYNSVIKVEKARVDFLLGKLEEIQDETPSADA